MAQRDAVLRDSSSTCPSTTSSTSCSTRLGDLPFIFMHRAPARARRSGASRRCSGSWARAGSRPTSPTTSRRASNDVWGQDAVLDKIKENLIFLEDPESIEQRGGHVPGGDPALRASRHRQDAHGRSGRGRDRASPSCSSSPARSLQHVPRRRRDEGAARCSRSCASWRCATAA